MDTRNKLARYAHATWIGWMTYMFELSIKNGDGSVTIPKWAVDRWARQMETPYKKLIAKEKESDLLEADRMIEIYENKVKG